MQKKLIFFLIYFFSFLSFTHLFAFQTSYDGIYKDIGSSNLNIYVQSYITGDTLLIYTFDTDEMVVVWDNKVENDLFEGNPVDPSVTESANFNFANGIFTIFYRDFHTFTQYNVDKFAEFETPLQIDGIYKSVDESIGLNIYVQSYNNGGTLLLFTFDTHKMKAFWDEKVEDNIFSSDVPINPAHQLSVEYDFNDNVLTITDLSGTTTYQCYKFAETVLLPPPPP